MLIHTLKRLLLLSLFFTRCGFATLQTISTPDELIHLLSDRDQVTEETLIVFDIDDTLLISPEQALRHPLFDTVIHRISDHYNIPPQSAFLYLFSLLDKTPFRIGKGELAFPELKPLIDGLIERRVKVIALTAVEPGQQHISLPQFHIDYTPSQTGEDRRIEDLSAVGIHLTLSLLPEATHLPLTSSHKGAPSPLYKRGVILSHKFPKGETLAAFLALAHITPAHIIFIDDRLQNVTSVLHTLEEVEGIPTTGVHFNYVARSLCTIDPHLFEQQLDHLITHGSWLPSHSTPIRLKYSPTKRCAKAHGVRRSV